MLLKKETPKFLKQQTKNKILYIYRYIDISTDMCMCTYTNNQTDVYTHTCTLQH